MNDEFDYLFTPDIEIEYLYKNVSIKQWDTIFNFFSLKYPNNKSVKSYTDFFFENNIRHNKSETICKTKQKVYFKTFSNIPFKCNVSTEKNILNFNPNKYISLNSRKKNKTSFIFKYYTVDLSEVIFEENKSYEIEIELNINKCRLEPLESIRKTVYTDVENFAKSFLS